MGNVHGSPPWPYPLSRPTLQPCWKTIANSEAPFHLNGVGNEIGPDLAKLDPKMTPADILGDRPILPRPRRRFMITVDPSHEASGTEAGARVMPPPLRTILLVDDDNEIIESMRTVLENKGYRIIVARDGNAGLTLAERENPDLIVLDMMMPKKSGFLVLEKLKGRPGGLIPTIMITGNEGSRHRAYAEMLGVKDYIRKPFAMEKLVKSIEKLLDGPTSARDDRG
jgi:CheY-like chemotaxis protein